MHSETQSKAAFLNKLANILELDEGAIKGGENLEAVAWDSLCALSFIVMMDEEFGLRISGSDLNEAETIDDLVALAGDKVSG